MVARYFKIPYKYKMGIQFYLLLLFTIIVGTFSVKYYHRIWNPVLLFTGMFFLGVVLAKHNCGSREFKLAVSWILIGELTFLLSYFAAQGIFNRKTLEDFSAPIKYNTAFLNIMIDVNVVVTILSLCLSIYEVIQVAPSFFEIFTNSTYVRELYLHRSSGKIVTILGIFLSLNFYVTFCLFPIGMQEKVKMIISRLIFVLFLRLCGSLITMSKAAFLIDIIFFISAYISTIKSKKEEYSFYLKYGAVFGILVIVLLVVITIQRNYIGDGRYSGYLDAIFGTLRTYISVSIEAFGSLLNIDSLQFTNGRLCFRPIFNILSYLGIGNHISIIQDVVSELPNVNVYSMFGNMYRDFSYIGIILLSVLFGFFFGAIYNTNYKYRLSNIVINSMVAMIMFFAYFDFKIIQTVYLFIMIYAVVIEKAIANRLYVKEDNRVTG